MLDPSPPPSPPHPSPRRISPGFETPEPSLLAILDLASTIVHNGWNEVQNRRYGHWKRAIISLCLYFFTYSLSFPSILSYIISFICTYFAILSPSTSIPDLVFLNSFANFQFFSTTKYLFFKVVEIAHSLLPFHALLELLLTQFAEKEEQMALAEILMEVRTYARYLRRYGTQTN